MAERKLFTALGVVSLFALACGGTNDSPGGAQAKSKDAAASADSSRPDARAPADAGDADGDAQPAGDGDAQAAGDGDAQAASCKVCTTCEQDIPPTGTANHVAGDLQYPDPPPTSGDHNPCWLNFGVYTTEQRDERWVHNLEHGGVVFLYNCPDGCKAEVASMASFVKSHEQALLTPYSLLPKKFAVVSWGHRLVTDCYTPAQFQAFYTAHVDQAPESIKTGPDPSLCANPP